ncbi:hypothetical protein ACFLVX_04340 [Chloroflexota bacterium]
MNPEEAKQGINLSQVLLPIATFIIGSWLVPKMDWISNTVKIWIFAFGIALAIFALLWINTVQEWLRTWIPNQMYVVIAITLVSLVIWVLVGVILTMKDRSNEDKNQLRTTIESLMGGITQFAADREFSNPLPTENWGAPDEWFQKSSAYRKQSEYLYKTQYQNKLATLGAQLRQSGYLKDEELKSYNWAINVGYPRASDLLNLLATFDNKLK